LNVGADSSSHGGPRDPLPPPTDFQGGVAADAIVDIATSGGASAKASRRLGGFWAPVP
jgi:hypothetical protein